jgi:ornithine cyclodeaminase/alanine dehydrogenase-like protein (mu-crystallin family)
MDAHLESRRSFLRAAAASAAALAGGCASSAAGGSTAASSTAASSTAASSARVLGSNGALRVGVIGLHGRGGDHLAGMRKLADVRIAAICDVDAAVLDKAVAAADKLGEKPRAFRDPRALLDSGEVDAITVATPNHWHSLLGVWAAQRGLHSYVEKPVSHDVWEGA